MIARFSEENPLFFFGISALLGTFLYFEPIQVLVFGWLVFHLCSSWKRALLQGAFILLFFSYSAFLFSSIPIPGKGSGVIAIKSVQRHRTPFASGWLYRGTLLAFQSADGSWQTTLPCSIVSFSEANRLSSGTYLCEGVLKQRDHYSYSFKPTEIVQIKSSFSLSELRLAAKEAIRSCLMHNMSRRAADFVCALFTGEIEDRSLRFEFGRVGLQHILAISGFHFALVASAGALILRSLFSFRPRMLSLLALATLYFLFIGNSPPVLRSFLAASLFLIGKLLNRRSSGLNLLGACLFFEIVLDPLTVLQLGFQLSFLSCTAILLFYAPIRSALFYLLPNRSLSEAESLSPLSQAAYVPISFFTRALTLTLAVNLALCPVLLYYFHTFPLLSLLYNLFVPALSGISLLLILPALALSPLLPLFAYPFFWASNFVSLRLLELIANPPASLSVSITTPFSKAILIAWLSILFLLGVYSRDRLAFFPHFK